MLRSPIKALVTRVTEGVRWRALSPRHLRLLLKSSHLWRLVLRKPAFVGITGSAGKSTTRDLLVGILSTKMSTSGNGNNKNELDDIAYSILQTRNRHGACVIELNAQSPSYIDEPIALLRPSVGIVTTIGSDHLGAYHSREAIAKEKSKLIHALPAHGTAVLNFDDELVLQMAAVAPGNVLTYGEAAGAELRAEDVTAVWPDRLSLTICHRGERVRVQTQLCGRHWVPAVLAAVGGALVLGMTLEECAKGIAGVPPFVGRMEACEGPDGVSFIRDDWKAPLWTVDASFDFMEKARAKRKVVVIGTLSDYGGDASAQYRRVARRAQEFADLTIFIGPWASRALRARESRRPSALRAFTRVRDAAEFLGSSLQPGDLVLLKGTNKQDHLVRLMLARTSQIACWRDDCKRFTFCNVCRDRMVPVDGEPTTVDAEAAGDVGQGDEAQAGVILIGLGNPDQRFVGTPHSIGHEVVERIAANLGWRWEQQGDAVIARGSYATEDVCLVKLGTAMNDSGVGARRLRESIVFDPERCILVHDDLDLAIGTVRTRLRGSAGGHRGVASILEAFQSDAFQRIKIGVRGSATIGDAATYVLTPFAEAVRPAMDAAVEAAAARGLELIKGVRRSKSG